MNADELFQLAYVNTHQAADQCSELHTRGAVSHEQAFRLLRTLRAATSAAQELERRAAGVPEPQKGDS